MFLFVTYALFATFMMGRNHVRLGLDLTLPEFLGMLTLGWFVWPIVTLLKAAEWIGHHWDVVLIKGKRK